MAIKRQLKILLAFALVTTSIGGYLLETRNNQASSLSLSITPPIAPIINPLKGGWKTYVAAKYSIKFPANWHVYECKDENQCIEISDVSNPQDIPLKISPDGHQIIGVRYYSGQMPTGFPYANGSTGQNPTFKQFTINAYTGLRGNEESTIGVNDVVYLPNSKGGYVDIEKEIGDTRIFDEILSSFNFTN